LTIYYIFVIFQRAGGGLSLLEISNIVRIVFNAHGPFKQFTDGQTDIDMSTFCSGAFPQSVKIVKTVR